MNQEHSKQAGTHKSLIESILGDALDVGAAWAAHGLRVGRSALETTALTLTRTAQALDRVADEIAANRAKRVESESDSTGSVAEGGPSQARDCPSA